MHIISNKVRSAVCQSAFRAVRSAALLCLENTPSTTVQCQTISAKQWQQQIKTHLYSACHSKNKVAFDSHQLDENAVRCLAKEAVEWDSNIFQLAVDCMHGMKQRKTRSHWPIVSFREKIGDRSQSIITESIGGSKGGMGRAIRSCPHRSRIRYLSQKNSRILTNFPKLKKFVKIRKKNSLNARVGVAFQQQLKNMMRFTVSC